MSIYTEEQLEQMRDDVEPQGTINPWPIVIALELAIWLAIDLVVRLVIA